MTTATAPRTAASRPPAPAAPPPAPPAARAPKARDFKEALARTTPPARPGPAQAPRPAPVAQPAIARGPAPAPTPAVAVAAVPSVTQAPALRPWEGLTNADFRQRIAEAERSAEHARDGYGLRNATSGALGRYQFLPLALRDIGWMDASGAWTEAAARHGATDETSFLANPAAQEAAMSTYLARQEVILDRNGALAAAGTTIRGLDGREIQLTEGALVAAAHRRGGGMLARYLAHRTETPDAPLTPAQRSAFASIEARLHGFSEVAYASERPGNRMMAQRAGRAG
jgi:hypothetical protein